VDKPDDHEAIAVPEKQTPESLDRLPAQQSSQQGQPVLSRSLLFLEALPPEERVAFLSKFIKSQPASEQMLLSSQLAGVLPAPAGRTRDLIWLIVISAFVLVLVGSFTVLAVGVFRKPMSSGVKPELILSMFTSVIGFLAGLFVPSPAGRSSSATVDDA
jgi:hypothetical protein